jgi:hypothetical protein
MKFRALRFVPVLSLALLPCASVRAQLPRSSGAGTPTYEVEARWPKQLPNQWIMGQVGGLCVDKHDHVWIIQRPRSLAPDELGAEQKPPLSDCCKNTPSVMEFDPEGNLLQAWGGPDYLPQWPKREHGIWVDGAGHVWIGGNDPADRGILKFTREGKLLMEIGRQSTEPQNNQDVTLLGQPASIEVDDAAHEVFIADGYMNKRVVVYDSETGAFKRGWGAYGIPLAQIDNGKPPAYNPASPVSPQFGNPVHSARLSVDGLVYVCDRINNRIQVFTKSGEFRYEFMIAPNTLLNGSTWSVAFSRDPQQKFLFVADGTNNVIWVVDRASCKVVSQFGHSGRNAGQFHWVHAAETDSKGNFYTGEVDNARRIQKFRLTGTK